MSESIADNSINTSSDSTTYTNNITESINDTIITTPKQLNSETFELVVMVEPVETVETTETANPIETIKTAQPVETVEIAQTVENANPVEIVQTFKTANPIETAQPVETFEIAQTVETANPVEIVQTVETANPIETANPVETVETVETAQTFETVETIETDETFETAQTIEIVETVNPVETVETAQTVETVNPVEIANAEELNIEFKEKAQHYKIKEESEQESEQESDEETDDFTKNNYEPLAAMISTLFQDLIKPITGNNDKNKDLTNLIEQLGKDKDDTSNFFGFDIKYVPVTKMTACYVNPDLEKEFKTDKDFLNSLSVKDSNQKEKNVQQNNNTKSSKKNMVDFYCSTGDLDSLNSYYDSVNKDEFEKNYTAVSMDSASLTNNINVLNWWLDKYNKDNVELKYSINALDNSSKLGLINILDWWYSSNLNLKYTERAIDLANITGQLSSLNWWLNKSKEENSKVEFKYSKKSFDRCKLEENEIMDLVKWWKDNKLEIKYSNEFIDFMGENRMSKLHKYLIDNKMIKQHETLNIQPNRMPQRNVINIMDLINGKTKSKPNYDTEGFPEEIIKHIEEKEAELDNNMLINGKAKEYIDSLVKIPFGKFRNEKIFKFMEDFINKLNSAIKEKYEETSALENDKLQSLVILKNESDIIKFFKNDQCKTTYNKLYDLYLEFIKLRVKYIGYIDQLLNETIFGHESTKKQFKCIISQWLSGGLNKGIVIGVQGPPGVGKTSLIKGALAKCLVDFIDYNLEDFTIKIVEETENNSRPFSFISLGGSANGSTLIGHNITYHGSTHGDIVKCLKQAKVMNPIIFFDELDKISKTENGYEISSVLTHITDPVQNEHFTDRYFTEVSIDLSKAIIVFSYNDASKIDRILLDRIKEINVSAISVREKVMIAKNFLIPEICKNIGYSKDDITLTDEQIKSVILEYTFEAGVRKLKEKLEEIIRCVHLDRLMKQDISEIDTIENNYIQEVMNEHHKINLKKINSEPKVGCINGMYATSNGLGDIMYIQVKKTYNKEPLTLQTTGSLEKVISESMNVAKTVAWNLLKPVERNLIINSFTNTGLHIHCPDGSTSKDGPSAGAAITCAIYSLFLNKSIKNNISMTGEIDLDGNITAIGGLDTKLTGAKRAGVKIAYVPEENRRDVDILIKKMPELIDIDFKIEFLSHISQAISKIF
jgi:ATP-dependent Lon protease